MGIPIVVRPVDVDETLRDGERGDAYLERIVAAKAREAVTHMDAANASAVLVADTVVLLDGVILGKPRDDAEAGAMIRRLAGREHVVATRYDVHGGDGASFVETIRTRVWFRELSDAHVERYVGTGEGRDKAGAYGIQGVGAMLVERIDGDYENVVGLPICAVVQALERLGLFAACPVVT